MQTHVTYVCKEMSINFSRLGRTYWTPFKFRQYARDPSTTLADFYGSFVAIVYGNAGMLAAEAD